MRATTRTLESRLRWPRSLIEYFEEELRAYFREAWVSGYELLIPQMTNHEKDRHVVAAAAHCEAPIILTLNLRHFRPEHLEQWNVRAIHPQEFLIGIFRQERGLLMTKLQQQAADRNRTMPQLLEILSATVPVFVDLVFMHCQ